MTPENLVAGEIPELTKLWNSRNKNQEIREHIWEIPELIFRLLHWQYREIRESANSQAEKSLVTSVKKS